MPERVVIFLAIIFAGVMIPVAPYLIAKLLGQ